MLDREIDPSEFGVLASYFANIALFIDDMRLTPAEKGDVNTLVYSHGNTTQNNCHGYTAGTGKSYLIHCIRLLGFYSLLLISFHSINKLKLPHHALYNKHKLLARRKICSACS